MKLVLQRVSEASVVVQGEMVGKIGQGLVVLLGIASSDTEKECQKLVDKLVRLRIFNDSEGKMNLSVSDVQGQLLVISQFTLYGDCRKGNRPSYMAAASPETAKPLYEYFVGRVQAIYPYGVETGIFGANMQVSLVNDGPVTICLES